MLKEWADERLVKHLGLPGVAGIWRKTESGGRVNKAARTRNRPAMPDRQKLRRARFHAALHLPHNIDERVQFVVELAHLLRMQLHRSLLIG